MFSSPARPGGSVPPSSPTSSTRGTGSSGSPAPDASAAALAAAGAEAVRGSLDDLDVLRAASAASDGVIHLAFDHETAFARGHEGRRRGGPPCRRGDGGGADRHRQAVRPRLRHPRGGGQDGHRARRARRAPGGRRPARCRGRGDPDGHRGVRARPRGPGSAPRSCAPAAHQPRRGGTTASSRPWSAPPARRASPVTTATGPTAGPPSTATTPPACSGSPWRRLPAGSTLHAVADEGVALRDVAEVVGRRLGLPTASVPPEEAAGHFGWLAAVLAADQPASSALTRELTGWRPVRPGLLADLEAGHYFRAPTASA